LHRFITNQLGNGNLLAFPEKDFQTCLVFDRTERFFQLWDVFGEKWLRKVKKQERSSGEDPDVFDVDLDGKVLAYIYADEILLQSLRIPDPMHKHIRPRYNLALHKENPAKIAQQRMTYTEKILNSIRIYEAIQRSTSHDHL
jgi:hypothetical protein